MSRLTAVGCGPGDPDLLTVKAVNAIKTADVILCPKSKGTDRPQLCTRHSHLRVSPLP